MPTRESATGAARTPEPKLRPRSPVLRSTQPRACRTSAGAGGTGNAGPGDGVGQGAYRRRGDAMWMIELHHGQGVPTQLQYEGDKVRIGRGRQNDIRLSGWGVSRRHAEIF